MIIGAPDVERVCAFELEHNPILIVHADGVQPSQVTAERVQSVAGRHFQIFKPRYGVDLINGHGHMDHAGAFAFFKKLTGAQVAIMEADVAMVEDGGKSDFHYGRAWQIMGQPPVKVDRVLRDGDTVRLGEVLLVAHHTPGHTRAATTWETTLVDGGRAYQRTGRSVHRRRSRRALL